MRQGDWLLAFPSKLWPISKKFCSGMQEKVNVCLHWWNLICDKGEAMLVKKERGKQDWILYIERGVKSKRDKLAYRTKKKRVSEERRDVWAVGNPLRNMKPLCGLVISRSDDLSKIRTATGDLPLSSLFSYLQLTFSSNPQDFHSPHPSRLSATVHLANGLSRVLGLLFMRKCPEASNHPTSA